MAGGGVYGAGDGTYTFLGLNLLLWRIKAKLSPVATCLCAS